MLPSNEGSNQTGMWILTPPSLTPQWNWLQTLRLAPWL